MEGILDRRKFVSLSTAAVANIAVSRLSAAQSIATVHIENPVTPARHVPIDFTGLSYETGQLYNADYFSPKNEALIAAFRGLSGHGVLRLGGHLSNITPWEGVGRNDPKQLRGVRHGVEDYWEWPLVDPIVQHHKQGMVSRQAIKNLRGFLDAVSWRLIYGLNFACGSAARAADEAAFVSTIMGDKLIAFVIGNEADGFGEDPFFRSKGYNFEQYIAEYETWVKAIRLKTPHAPFAGPDTEGHVGTWVEEYGIRTRGDAVMLTSHFYAMGPAIDPAMTAERLLQKVNPDLEEQILAVASAVAAAGGTPYRMDEGNSCFGGGKDGVSNAYASALWVADYMLHVACAGFIGVNLHGGGTGYYAPIESSRQSPAAPRPMYYGMQFAQQFAGYKLAPCAKTSENLTAYFGTRGQQTLLAVINKSARPIQVTPPGGLFMNPINERWILTGPSLDAKNDVRFTKEPATASTALIVPKFSAVLLGDR